MPTTLLTDGPIKPPGDPLPERYVLHLNALEVGYVQALLMIRRAKETEAGNPESISTRMREQILEKVIAIVNGGLE